MITTIIISLVAAILYLFYRKGNTGGRLTAKESKRKIYLIFLIGVLTLLAIFSPKAQERIHTFRQKMRL